ncbi:hypothetical protein [Clostridium pasteurianum]|uniref:Lipoprotein n=1 Tax=Clostridium pasteurianum BC1 TaxID=86416 RepID=R4K300_CLOPA|nr:hypothetical protein [Clostridium pasteurianum]AGK97482.1 hypothetical protein Clopa_2624 [Clostridium pasteurianum BC1]
MRRFKDFNKIAIVLLALTMSIFLFLGCNKNISSSQNTTQKLIRKAPTKDALKKDYEARIQPLVNDATITKDQADKVLTYLTANLDTLTKESIQKQNNTLDKLVNDKIITRQQADKIINALRK